MKQIIKGDVRAGVVDIDLGSGYYGTRYGEVVLALLDRDGNHLRPAVVGPLEGFSFLPAEITNAAPSGQPLTDAAAALGELVADDGFAAGYREWSLAAICDVPQALPYLVRATGSRQPAIKMRALGCRVIQHDLGPLRALASLVAGAAAPANTDAAYALEDIRDAAAVPLLLQIARGGQPAYRLAALRGLWPNHPPAASATPVYREALLDGTPAEQNAAVQGLIALHGGEISEYDYFMHHRQEVIEQWLRQTAPGSH